jgi:hypothetical protein
MHENVVLIWGLFFGLHLLVFGCLVYKSGYLPSFWSSSCLLWHYAALFKILKICFSHKTKRSSPRLALSCLLKSHSSYGFWLKVSILNNGKNVLPNLPEKYPRRRDRDIVTLEYNG